MCSNICDTVSSHMRQKGHWRGGKREIGEERAEEQNGVAEIAEGERGGEREWWEELWREGRREKGSGRLGRSPLS